MTTEKRLIDANELEREIQKMFVPYGDGTYPGDYEKMLHAETLVDVLETMNEQPSVDTVEVVHGYWIRHYDDIFPAESTQECSVCHEHEDMLLCNENYCPNCGARMDQ